MPKTAASLPEIQPHAAGIDIGATAIYVAVPRDAAPQPVRRFETFTADLNEMAEWLEACRIKTVAMESTGVYWIPVFQILESHGFEVCLVNARHVKNVPGRKSDVSDCQWLQYLHAVGLLQRSFRPPQAVCAIRSIVRHRDSMIAAGASHIQHMQKALTQMNVQIHHVLSDLTGATGRAIVEAILAGERDPDRLADLRNPRVKASRETIRKSLEGDWRGEHLFALRQAHESWKHCRTMIRECDSEIERMLKGFDGPDDASRSEAVIDLEDEPSEAIFDLKAELERIQGSDLTLVPGLDTLSSYRLFSEIGREISAFPTSGHFASWLGLCPDNRISGDKVLSSRTRKVKHRAATILRLAAQTLHRSQTSLGAYYRRMRTRFGAPKAITATAHKLARIIYHLLKTRQSYDESVFVRNETDYKERRIKRLHREAASFGFQLLPSSEPEGSLVS